jgi:gamma-glutamylcyclotransferase (GGCT)/AIG2-like uncharacterized protein YtfP
VNHAPYPGISSSPDSSVTGLLLYLSDERYYDLLDLYEGDEYERRTVIVTLAEDELHPEEVECDVYVYVGEWRSKEEWSFEEFVREYENSRKG